VGAFDWISMLGGLAFFFFGLDSARQGLQLAAGERLRMLLGKMTKNRFFALIFGALITIVLQSSTATTVILVSFAEAQLITLTQAFGVILGADIGTTFVVILLTFKKITHYALLVIALGIALEKLSKVPMVKYVGAIILGFGMIFFGMGLMTSAATPLRESEAAITIFQFLAKNPFWNIIFATIFSGLIHSSAATIGLAIALSYSGVLTFETSIPIVLGANIGTCVTAGLSCFGMGIRGRQVALAHVMVKLMGVAIVFPFLDQFAALIDRIDHVITNQSILPALAASGKIALTHITFNAFLAILFMPLAGPFVWMIQKLIPYRDIGEKRFKPKYIDEAALETPALAFAQAKSETMRIAQIARMMFKLSLKIFHTNVDHQGIVESIENDDDRIDVLEKAIRFYIAKISQKSLTENQSQTQMSLLSIGDEIEAIGDIVSKDIVALSFKKRKKMVRFSEEGWAELEKLFSLISENFDLTMAMMVHPDEDIFRKIQRHERYMDDIERDLRHSHLMRLNEMRAESHETSTIHLELISQLRLVNARLAKIARAAAALK